MKKFNILLLLLLFVGAVANGQSYTREGNTYISSTGELTVNTAIETSFKAKEKDGKLYTIYCSKRSGACFIKKVSKNGKEYRKYLGEKISKEICKEIGVVYRSKTK